MAHNDELEFNCECGASVPFSIMKIAHNNTCITCSVCHKQYGFQDSILQQKLRLFVKLCTTLRECESILGDSSIAVDVGIHRTKIPFKLLLTRLRSTIDLHIGNKTCSITYRMEPSRVAEKLATVEPAE